MLGCELAHGELRLQGCTGNRYGHGPHAIHRPAELGCVALLAYLFRQHVHRRVHASGAITERTNRSINFFGVPLADDVRLRSTRIDRDGEELAMRLDIQVSQ